MFSISTSPGSIESTLDVEFLNAVITSRRLKLEIGCHSVFLSHFLACFSFSRLRFLSFLRHKSLRIEWLVRFFGCFYGCDVLRPHVISLLTTNTMIAKLYSDDFPGSLLLFQQKADKNELHNSRCKRRRLELGNVDLRYLTAFQFEVICRNSG